MVLIKSVNKMTKHHQEKYTVFYSLKTFTHIKQNFIARKFNKF